MVGMMLAVASDSATVVGVDLADKVPVARRNLLAQDGACPFVPFAEERFSLLGGDVFDYLAEWERENKVFDVVYAGCSLDPGTDQLRRFLGRLRGNGAAVFNLGEPGMQGMYFVSDKGRVCELMMRVNFMMCESQLTPRSDAGERVPLDPRELGEWIRQNVYAGHGEF